MGFGNLYFNFGESGGDFLCQHRHNGVLGVKMTGINQIHADVIGIPELVVFDICCDKGITACGESFHHLISAGTAADGNLANRLASVYITHPIATQLFFYGGKEGFQRLLHYVAAAEQTVTVHRVDDLDILQTQLYSQHIVDTAGNLI